MPLTEPDGVYRPRHPGRTVVYRLFEDHFERYVREYQDRYEAREGSLRKVGSEMKIVSVITQLDVIDAILRHLAKTGGRDPFEGRAPPAA